MKKMVFILSFCMGWGVAAIAQQTDASPAENNQKKLDQLESYRIAYISKKLDLSPQEAEKFWPVYNNYQDEIEQLIAERKNSKQKLEKLTDDQVQQNANDEIKFEERLLDVRKKYMNEFRRVLPQRKAAMVFHAEREMRGQLIRELQARRNLQIQQQQQRHRGRF